MKDLTQGPITGHVVTLALPIFFGLIVQTLYFLIDLYFVSRLGPSAIAGVSAAGNVMFLCMGLTQVLSIGTAALVAHAVGRKDPVDATHVFNQSLVISAACGLLVLVLGYGLGPGYVRTLTADSATAEQGVRYLDWFLPGLAVQFALISMGAALRGTGIVKPTMVVQLATVGLNALLAPVLIAGWITGHPLGVAGAGLASTLAIFAGVVLLVMYFERLEKYVHYAKSELKPRFATWWRLFAIGLPAGGEFALLFIYLAVIYTLIRPFGADAQAGFGIGQRLMQALFLPAMAVSFAAQPIAGQNFAAGHGMRVRATFRDCVLISSGLMAVLTVIAQFTAARIVVPFSDSEAVRAGAVVFLTTISFNFVASGITFTCSALFQGLGNTVPSLLASATRIVTFVLPGIWLSWQPDFSLQKLWYLSVATVNLQAVLSLLLLWREMKKRLVDAPVPVSAVRDAG
jgi:putative MATE family efflux protein